MLIEFSVTNYKCYKDKQTLSMVATSDKDHPQNLIEAKVKGLGKDKLLKSAALYGANASGKSNFLDALNFMKWFVQNSATKVQPDEAIGVKPFLLDSKTEKSPSEFEIMFIHQGIKYQYGFKLDAKRVYEEWLFAWKTAQSQKWFYRNYNAKKNEYDYEWGTSFKGEKKSLVDKTRANNLFVSVAAQFNHEQLQTVYQWFRQNIRLLDTMGIYQSPFTSLSIQEDSVKKDQVVSLLQQADIGIQDIEVRERTKDNIVFPEDLPEELKKFYLKNIEEGNAIDLQFIHTQRDTGKQLEFARDEESLGTNKFYSLLGPFLDVLGNGYTLLLDELASSMHPLLTRKLIQLFNSEANTNNAQLIFTTHDTTQLETSTLFRRDQIWFTRKRNDGSSELYPLTHYKPRKEEALQKGYLAGRYGGIPILDEELVLE